MKLRFKKYQPAGNQKLNYSGIFQSLKLRISKNISLLETRNQII